MATRWLCVTLSLIVPAAALAQGSESGRTRWGDPDLQGVWTNATLTPVERPVSLEGKATYTEAEVEIWELNTDQRLAEANAPSVVRDEPLPAGGNVGAYNQFWMDGGTRVVGDRRTSLIVHPADGRIPWRPEARKHFEESFAKYGVGPFAGVLDLDTGERCLTDGLPMVPLQGYNMNYQIFQTESWVAIQHEMFHEYRIIPLDGRAHVDGVIGQWLGDSRGRWEGDTLVIETTNFADRRDALWRHTWRSARPTLHLTERFRRVDDGTLEYSFTIDDPEMFTSPWTASVPLTTDQASRGVTKGPLFEYACHEGNYAIPGVLGGARLEETVTPVR